MKIFRHTVTAITIWLTLIQFAIPIINPSGFEIGLQNNNQDKIVSVCTMENSPGKVENQVKKYDKVTANESSEYNHVTKQKYFTNFEVENYTQIRLLYTIKIINILNKTRFSLNHLDLRSPPSYIS